MFTFEMLYANLYKIFDSRMPVSVLTEQVSQMHKYPYPHMQDPTLIVALQAAKLFKYPHLQLPTRRRLRSRNKNNESARHKNLSQAGRAS